MMDFSSFADPRCADEAKQLATLRARLALAGGYELDVIERDDAAPSYAVRRWGLFRVLPDLEAVARFVDQVTGGTR